MHTVRMGRFFSVVAWVALLMRCLPVIAQDKDIEVLPNHLTPVVEFQITMNKPTVVIGETVELIGHTDPQGSDAYNLQLSERRAEAVKVYLEREYRGRIRTAGRGKREPYQPDDPQKYTQEELYRLHRRVEIQFK